MSLGRSFSRAVLASAAVLALSGGANAGVLFQNPNPISSSPHNVDAFTISTGSGFVVADTFNLSSNSNLSSIDFVSWNLTGEHISTVDWSISSGPGSGTVFGSGTANVTDSLLGTNSFGFDIELDTFTLSLNLSAGTYWLNLFNADVGGDIVGWDQGGGSSQAWENTLGFLTADNNCQAAGTTDGSCAETFRINGTSSAVPEPITLSLFGAGLVGAAALRRRKTKTA